MPNTVKSKPVAAHPRPLDHTLLAIFRLLQINSDQFRSIKTNSDQYANSLGNRLPSNGLIVINQRFKCNRSK